MIATQEKIDGELEYMAYLARMGNGFVVEDGERLGWCYGTSDVQVHANRGRSVQRESGKKVRLVKGK